MVRRNLDQDQDQAVWVGYAKLDQAPGFLDRTLDDWNPGRAQLLLRPAHVSDLEPKLCGRGGRLDAPVGQLEVTAAQEEDDAARVIVPKLPHRMEAEDIAIEAQAAVEIARMQHESAGKYLHRIRSESLHCPGSAAGYIRLVSLA